MARKKKVKEVLPAVLSSEEESEDEKEESEDEKEEADEDEDGEEETEGSSDSEEDSESDSDGHAPPASDSPAAMPKKSAAPPAVMPTPASTPPKATSSVSKPNSPAAKRKKSAKSAAPAPTPPIADSPAAEPTSRVSKRTAEATSSVSEPIPDSPAAKTEKSAPAANPKKAAPASAPTPPSPSPSPTSKKRAAEERDPNPKENKKKAVGGEEDTKRKQRLWSDKDELTILNGMIDFKDKTGGLLPSAATFPAFHESLENNFEAQVDVRQLMYKVNKLRSKFTRKGNARVFTTPHDLESFELSRKIWGGVSEKASTSGMKGGGGNLGASLSGMKLRASSSAIKGNLRSSEQQDVGEVMANVDETNVDETNYPRMMSSLRRAFPDHADRDLFRYIGHAKAKEFEGMWDKLFEETVDLCMLQHDLSIKKLNLENAQMKCLKEKEKD